MVATPSTPAVPMVRHKAIAWPAPERAAVAKQLEAFGVTITELSDVRERCGLPRLSSTEPSVRWAAVHILRGRKGQAALAEVRAERTALIGKLRAMHRDTVFNARHLLGIRRNTPSTLRLNELRALYDQARLLELCNR
jgi:hypothetical protein